MTLGVIEVVLNVIITKIDSDVGWGIYITIDMSLSTKLILIPLYKMTPIKLRKLKEKLKDLLEKGVIKQCFTIRCTNLVCETETLLSEDVYLLSIPEQG